MIASKSTEALELYGWVRACLLKLWVPPSEEQGVGLKTSEAPIRPSKDRPPTPRGGKYRCRLMLSQTSIQ